MLNSKTVLVAPPNQLGIGDLFSDSALPELCIPNPQLDIFSTIVDLRSPIWDNMPNWGYIMLVLYCGGPIPNICNSVATDNRLHLKKYIYILSHWI